MATKKGKALPKMGKDLHQADAKDAAGIYCTGVAKALRDELGASHQAIKRVRRWTGASERTVKYWFAGRSGPTGEHLVALFRHSDVVLRTILVQANRSPAAVIDGRLRLAELIEEMAAIINAQAAG